MTEGVSEPVVAAYQGVCDLCGDVIKADKDRIVKLEDDDCWVHVRCAREDGYDVDD